MKYKWSLAKYLLKLQAKMAQCTTPLSPENLPGPSGHASGLSQVEQEKEKSPQDSSSGLYQSSNEEFIDNYFLSPHPPLSNHNKKKVTFLNTESSISKQTKKIFI